MYPEKDITYREKALLYFYNREYLVKISEKCFPYEYYFSVQIESILLTAIYRRILSWQTLQ